MKKFLLIDIETANFVECPFAYDVGFIIADKKQIYEKHSYLVYDIFVKEKDLMYSAYYAEKIPLYEQMIKDGTIQMKTLYTIQKIIKEKMKEYEITDVFAYNAYFDSGGMNNTIRWDTKSAFRWFFPYGTKFHCIQHMACQVLFTQKTYFKIADREGWKTEKGNYKTTAEHAFKYINLLFDFEERHTGLEDCLIEYEILKRCYRQKKKMKTGINRACWRIPQKVKKEMDS